MRARSIGFHDASLEATSGRRSFPERISDELFKVCGSEACVGESFGGCDQVGVGFGFHYLNRASIARRSLQLPEGNRGKLSFNEVD
jgi:hypothetical protein